MLDFVLLYFNLKVSVFPQNNVCSLFSGYLGASSTCLQYGVDVLVSCDRCTGGLVELVNATEVKM